jgi:hypothetical protein
VTEVRQLAEGMQHAYERGDHRRARELAKQIAAGERLPGEDEAHASAEALLARTQPDAFLLVVGTLGLGLTAWLVYNYVL